jgi:hypothetical protein
VNVGDDRLVLGTRSAIERESARLGIGRAAAARYVASCSHGAIDAAYLLDVLGLSATEALSAVTTVAS